MSVYFLTCLSSITLLPWDKNPSVVFDQGALNVWGRERLLPQSICNEEDYFFDSFNFTKPTSTFIFDWETSNDVDWDILPTLHAPLLSPSVLKDCHFPMSAPDRTRKLSISDIIDVLTLQDSKVSLFGKKDNSVAPATLTEASGYSSTTPEPPSSLSSGIYSANSSSEELSPSINEHKINNSEKRFFFPYNTNSSSAVDSSGRTTDQTEELFIALQATDQHDQSEQMEICPAENANKETHVRFKPDKPIISNATTKEATDRRMQHESLEKPAHLHMEKGEIKIESYNKSALSIETASNLLHSKDDAIIVVLNKNRKVQYMSTSRKKLENYLTKETECLQSFTSETAKETHCISQRVECSLTNKMSQGHVKHEKFSTSSSETDSSFIQTVKQPKKCGRKRVYEPNKNEEERGVMKRERNNEACRKFRKSRKQKLSSLFDVESNLLQQNLNLKEQVAALNRQVLYMKEKLKSLSICTELQ